MAGFAASFFGSSLPHPLHTTHSAIQAIARIVTQYAMLKLARLRPLRLVLRTLLEPRVPLRRVPDLRAPAAAARACTRAHTRRVLRERISRGVADGARLSRDRLRSLARDDRP